MKALTAAEMREVDRLTTERFGIPGLELMEAAGKSVAEVFLGKYKERYGNRPGRVSVLCGKGNNGGDGFVVARHLKGRVGQVKVYLFAEPRELRGDAGTNYERWRGSGEEVVLVRNEAEWVNAWTGVAASEVIVDALLGHQVVVVPVLVTAAGCERRTVGHLVATIREPTNVIVLPAIVDLGTGTVEVVGSRSLLPGDPARVQARLHALLAWDRPAPDPSW